VFGAPPTSQNWAGTIEVGPDGRIFVGGVRTYTTQVTSGKGKKQTTTNQDVTTGSLLKLNANGSIDTYFGEDGYLDTGWSVPWNFTFRGTSSSYDVIIAGAVQVQTEVSGGGGRGKKGGGTQTIDTSALALHAVDGLTGGDVTSFGDNGIAVDDLSPTTLDRPRGVRIDDLGRIVVLSHSAEAQSSDEDMVITRYSSTGVLETAFGTDGRLSVGSVGNGNYLHNYLAIDGDGKRILLAARSPTSGGNFETIVVRYAENGSGIDTTFDIPEIADTSGTTTVYDTWPVDIDVDANGKVCVALYSGLGNLDATIVRCNADGTRDTGFGPNADGLSENLDLSDEEEPKALVIDSNGHLILVGQSSYPVENVQPYYEAVLVRFDG
jgi:uncharacterized delta-60 repeat protein